MRATIAGSATLDSSKEKAPTSCSRSGSLRLFQKRVAWLKWSSKDWGRRRALTPSTGWGKWT